MLNPEIEELTFETAKQVWSGKLWTSRKQEIKPISSVSRYLEIDMSIYDYEETVKFWGLRLHGKIMGINSCFQTDNLSCRSRGLWVDPEYRGHGLSKLLLQQAIEYAKKNNCSILWTLPRKSSLQVYESFGFIKKTDWFDEHMDFGPNCLAEIEVSLD